MDTTSQSNWTLRDFFGVLFRYRRRVIVFFAGTMVLAVLALIVWPRKYESEAKLFVRIGRENVALDPTATTGKVIALDSSREVEINSVVEMLSSRSMVEKVVDLLQPKTTPISPREREKLIRRLSKDISVASPRMSAVVCVSCEAGTPERAQKTVATLLGVYLSEHLRVNRNPGSYKFFEEQSELLRVELDGAIGDLRDMKNRFGMASLEGHRLALQKQISNNELQIYQTESALSASEAKIESMRGSLETLPEPLIRQLVGGVPTDAFADMRQQLYRLQAQEQELLSRCTEVHPSVITIRQQVRGLKRILEAEKPNRNEAMAAVMAKEESNAESLRARRQSLASQWAELESDLRTFTQQEVQIKQHERKVRQLEVQHFSYVEKFEQARVDQALKTERISNINVIQPASFVLRPIAPRKAIILVLAFIVATLGAAGVALLSDYLDPSLRDCEDVEAKLDLPMLASIPHMERDHLIFSTNN